MRKGYIGPLGDDFPALFPILLGLMLFFSAVTLTYQIFEAKNAQVNSMRANIMLSRAIRERKHLNSTYWTNYACPLLLTARTNYGVKAAMRIDRSSYTRYAEPLAPRYELNIKDPFYFDNPLTIEPAVCFEGGTPPIDFDQWEDQVPVAEKTMGRNFISMTYPIIIDIDATGNKQSLTAELTVVTWT